MDLRNCDKFLTPLTTLGGDADLKKVTASIALSRTKIYRYTSTSQMVLTNTGTVVQIIPVVSSGETILGSLAAMGMLNFKLPC